MTEYLTDIAFTPAVKQVQQQFGTRDHCARLEKKGRWKVEISDDVAQFISQRDSFYLGTSSKKGRPYIQHRGGKPGFIHVIDRKTLAFGDYPGNKQFITAGNLSENDQAFIFMMDYATQARVKFWGRAWFECVDREFIDQVTWPVTNTVLPRVCIFRIEAWDINCKQYITKRHSETQVNSIVVKLRDRIEELEEELRSKSIEC